MIFFSHLRAEPTNRRIALGFMVAMVLIVSGFATSFSSYSQYGEDAEQVKHTYEVVGALESTLSLLKDVETGSRGYVITNDSAYLEPYLTALRLLPAQLSRLQTLVTDNSAQTRQTAVLKQLVDDKIASSKLRVGTDLSDQQRGLSHSGEGKRRMDRVVMYHHGFITARSYPNQGTTFVVVLPESQLNQDYDRSSSTETHSHFAG